MRDEAMTNEPEYVHQKVVIALGMLNARSGSLGKRVRNAWEEMSVLEQDDFDDATASADYAYLQSRRELYVVEPLTPKLNDDEMRDVERRIRRIHYSVVKRC